MFDTESCWAPPERQLPGVGDACLELAVIQWRLSR